MYLFGQNNRLRCKLAGGVAQLRGSSARRRSRARGRKATNMVRRVSCQVNVHVCQARVCCLNAAGRRRARVWDILQTRYGNKAAVAILIRNLIPVGTYLFGHFHDLVATNRKIEASNCCEVFERNEIVGFPGSTKAIAARSRGRGLHSQRFCETLRIFDSKAFKG